MTRNDEILFNDLQWRRTRRTTEIQLLPSKTGRPCFSVRVHPMNKNDWGVWTPSSFYTKGSIPVNNTVLRVTTTGTDVSRRPNPFSTVQVLLLHTKGYRRITVTSKGKSEERSRRSKWTTSTVLNISHPILCPDRVGGTQRYSHQHFTGRT